MKLNFDFETVDMGDEIIAVPVGDHAKEIAGVLKLNKTGTEVLELLKQGKEKDEIVRAITSKYDNDPGEIKGLVDKFFDNLLDLGLLVQ